MPKPTSVEIAAGGLLERDADGSVEIAVIHRSRYDDWSLPKGHLEPGETLEEAAVREVHEETGCEGEIVKIVSPTAYLVNERPKIVVFYRMKLIKCGSFTPNEEVASIHWLVPAKAVDALSYETEKSLISSVYGL